MPPLDPWRQLIVARNTQGLPFAFLPLLCRIYSLDEEELTPLAHLDNMGTFVLADVAAIPAIEEEYLDVVGDQPPQIFCRQHTPGIALIVTQSCNLACSYCLAKQGSFGLPTRWMDAKDILKRIDELFTEYPDIGFVKFFGGEPTLRMDIIEDVCRHITEILEKRVRFAITTNGTGNASQHLDLWMRYHVNVSVSIDGPQFIHDSQRRTRSGQGSYDNAIKYCHYLKEHGFPFSVVGVFDERHIKNDVTYLDVIRFLNKLSPVVKVQFIEALGDAGRNPAFDSFGPNQARQQIDQAVDSVWHHMTSTWVHPTQESWIYDNNIVRFAYGVVKGKATPYEHACTAANLTTVMPSGELMPCYTFSERPDLHFGNQSTSFASVERSRREYRSRYAWEHLASNGAHAPWYRGIVGDICVADMINSDAPGLKSSLFYRTFQEIASLRTLQHAASLEPGTIEHVRVLRALEAHERLTGMYSSQSNADASQQRN